MKKLAFAAALLSTALTLPALAQDKKIRLGVLTDMSSFASDSTGMGSSSVPDRLPSSAISQVVRLP